MITAMLGALNTVKAQNPPAISILPSSIVDMSILPGSVITINASVTDAVDVFTWQVKVLYNPSLLNCTGATYPSDNIYAGKPSVPVTPQINPVLGSVTFGQSLIGSAAGFTGNGTLCQITFTVLGRGTSDLDLSKPYGSDTFLLDTNLNVIPALENDGFFQNGLTPQPPVASFTYLPTVVIVGQVITFNGSASYDTDGGAISSYQWTFGDGGSGSGETATHTYLAAGGYVAMLTVTDADDGLTATASQNITVYESRPALLYIDPPEIIDPTLLPPQIVTVNVTVDYVTNMYDYMFRLSYNNQMLTCIGALINRVQDQTAFSPIIYIDDGAGFIFVNVTYHAPAVPISTITPLALVTVYFQVSAPGSSTLHLSDTELSDPAHQPMAHATQDGFIMTLIRDVAITAVVPSTSWAYQGWPVDVAVTAENLGNISESFDVSALYDGNLIGTLPVVNLAPNAETTVEIHWNTSGVAEGNYTISGQASFVPFEFNTTNNFLTDGNVQILTQIRDVAITNVTTSRSWVYAGMPVNITVTAENVGQVVESFDVQVFYGSNLFATQPVVDLAAGAEVVYTFTLDTTNLSTCVNYTISAQASIVPFEFNTTNNVFVDGVLVVRLVGDINGDGRVDMRDIAIAAAAFGSSPGTPRWNPNADITGRTYLVPDGVVDMRDVALIAKNFGKGC